MVLSFGMRLILFLYFIFLFREAIPNKILFCGTIKVSSARVAEYKRSKCHWRRSYCRWIIILYAKRVCVFVPHHFTIWPSLASMSLFCFRSLRSEYVDRTKLYVREMLNAKMSSHNTVSHCRYVSSCESDVMRCENVMDECVFMAWRHFNHVSIFFSRVICLRNYTALAKDGIACCCFCEEIRARWLSFWWGCEIFEPFSLMSYIFDGTAWLCQSNFACFET